MKFTKMHGLGNDYIYVNCFLEELPNPSEVAKKVSDRHFGIGSDGLVLIMPSILPISVCVCLIRTARKRKCVATPYAVLANMFMINNLTDKNLLLLKPYQVLKPWSCL